LTTHKPKNNSIVTDYTAVFQRMYMKTILTTTLGFLIVPFLSLYTEGQAQNYKTFTVFTGPIHLGSGHTYWTKFPIPQNVTSSFLKGYVRASGSILNTVTVKLYDVDKCPPPDSGTIDFSKCSSPLLSGDYLKAEEIVKHIDHAGNLYLVLKNNSPLFDKTVSGNLLIQYLG
jgi:hypothetical protein